MYKFLILFRFYLERGDPKDVVVQVGIVFFLPTARFIITGRYCVHAITVGNYVKGCICREHVKKSRYIFFNSTRVLSPLHIVKKILISFIIIYLLIFIISYTIFLLALLKYVACRTKLFSWNCS